jgi:hypothetical protein
MLDETTIGTLSDFGKFIQNTRGKRIMTPEGKALSKAAAYWLLQREPNTKLSYFTKPNYN